MISSSAATRSFEWRAFVRGTVRLIPSMGGIPFAQDRFGRFPHRRIGSVRQPAATAMGRPLPPEHTSKRGTFEEGTENGLVAVSLLPVRPGVILSHALHVGKSFAEGPLRIDYSNASPVVFARKISMESTTPEDSLTGGLNQGVLHRQQRRGGRASVPRLLWPGGYEEPRKSKHQQPGSPCE